MNKRIIITDNKCFLLQVSMIQEQQYNFSDKLILSRLGKYSLEIDQPHIYQSYSTMQSLSLLSMLSAF